MKPIEKIIIGAIHAYFWLDRQRFILRARWIVWRHDRAMRKMGYRGP